jgi:hypothetical protein
MYGSDGSTIGQVWVIHRSNMGHMGTWVMYGSYMGRVWVIWVNNWLCMGYTWVMLTYIWPKWPMCDSWLTHTRPIWPMYDPWLVIIWVTWVIYGSDGSTIGQVWVIHESCLDHVGHIDQPWVKNGSSGSSPCDPYMTLAICQNLVQRPITDFPKQRYVHRVCKCWERAFSILFVFQRDVKM